METGRLAAVTGPGGPGSGYAVGGRLVLTSAHVTGPIGTRAEVFHPGGDGLAGGVVLWAGTPKGRDDAALVLVDDSPHWQPPTAPVRWGRLVTNRPGTACETWGVPDEAQRPRLAVEAEHLEGRINPGTGFVNNQYILDLTQHPPHWSADGESPWGGLSGAAVHCGRLLTGVVAADRARSGHARLNVVPAYVLAHDPAFRATLLQHGGGSPAGLEAVEFQDLADPAHVPGTRPAPATPAALLEASRQIVPFHGRQELLAELAAWCGLGGFGAWLIHGPGGQGKTRLAHHLADRLITDGWTVLWPRTTASAEQLAAIRHAVRPLLIVLDYAENRTDQLTTIVEAAAEHPGTSPLKVLLLARTEGDWWRQATTENALAGDYLATARTHHLAPLEDDPDRRPDHYRDVTTGLAAALPQVKSPTGEGWGAAPEVLLTKRDLTAPAYGNALTLHMTALADLLDTNRPVYEQTGTNQAEANAVEDRLLAHERRYWRHQATAHGISPALSNTTLETALAAAHLAGAADRHQADRLWQRLTALGDQPRDRRDQVTAWLAALYPAPGSHPWGALQPDRLAERHTGRVLRADPQLADHLLDGADNTQAAQILTVYSRAAAHPTLQLDTYLTDLCVRRLHQLAQHIIATATRTDHPAPLTAALDSTIAHPSTSLDTLTGLHNLFPPASRRLARTAVRLSQSITDRYRTLAGANPDAYLPGLATALNNLSSRLGGVGRREEGLAASLEAVSLYRSLAEANPDAYLPDLATALNNLSARLGEVGRREEGLAAIQQTVTIRRSLTEANPDAYLPDLAGSLNNLSVRLGEVGQREESLAVILEAVGHYRRLAEANPDAYVPDLAMTLNNLSSKLGEVGRREEGLATSLEAVGHYRRLAEANPDAYLRDLAMTLSNLSIRLGGMGRQEEGLAASMEAVGHCRTLAGASPDAYLPNLAAALNNLSNRLGEVGRREDGLAAIQEAVTIRRTLAGANPDAYLPNLAIALNNLSNRLGEVGRREDGLAAIEEAVGHYRSLAGANPDTYLPDLAMTLNNLSADLGEAGRWEEGLAAIEEAVGHYRSLAGANPDTYLPNLAAALNNLSNRLGEVGRREESLAAIEEAVGHYRSLAGANPNAYLPDLAMTLNNLAIRLGEVDRREEGLAAIQEAVSHYRALAEADPTLFNAGLQQSLTVAAWLADLE